jgi:hypothetical protein
MEISGSVHGNLRAALQSARRLREGPIHPDTLEHWARLVVLAKSEKPAMESFKTRELINDLEREIGLRTVAAR